MRSIRRPIFGAFLLATAILPSAGSAQPTPSAPPVVTPADCAHPAPPVRLATRILCSAVLLTRLSARIDESAHALRLGLAPDERARFDGDQAAWVAGYRAACQADGEGQADPVREITARDCIVASFTNRLPAMRHIVGTWRASTMRDCAITARVLSLVVPAQRTITLTSRITRYEETAAALRYLAHVHSAEFGGGGGGDTDAEGRFRAQIAADGQAKAVQRAQAVLADCDKKHDAYQARVPLSRPIGPANPATQPPEALAALAPSPIRALCNGLVAERDALDRCLTRKAVAYYEGRVAEAGQQALNSGAVPHPQTHESWATYRERHCSWSVAHVSDQERVAQHDRCLLQLAARRDLELRDALAARERYRAPPTPAPASPAQAAPANKGT